MEERISRNVTISYVNDDGEAMSYQGELPDTDLLILIRQLDGESLDEIVAGSHRFNNNDTEFE